MINRSYLQHVAMVESQCENKKKQPMISTYTKSPLRDRQNRMNLGNTPNRLGPKTSLSPLRSRRTESSLVGRVNFSRRKVQPMCINDPHKAAKFITYSEEETLYYCEKCAILLASQGFPVTKLTTSESMEINPRKQQIDAFLRQLDAIVGTLTKKQQLLNTNIKEVMQVYEQEEAKVEEYYGNFYEIINEHKRRVIQQLKEEYESSVRQTNEKINLLDSAVNDSKRMKADIIQSLSIIIYDTNQQKFRPIMSNYQINLKEYKHLGNKTQTESMINMRKLDFKDPEQACNALEEGLQIHWSEKGLMEISKQSEGPQNPVEVIEIDEKFTKSSLRQIGNLFSSFDDE